MFRSSPPCTHLYALVLDPHPLLDAYIINGRPLKLYHNFALFYWRRSGPRGGGGGGVGGCITYPNDCNANVVCI